MDFKCNLAEFKPFPKIERMGKAIMQITQKIHGTNAQVFITHASHDNFGHPNYIDVDGMAYFLYVGSRTRWIYPGDDNYGFAAHVFANKEEFVRKLGVGQHFGEWAGLGINSGEGLTEKVFVLFDFWKYPPERPLPPKCMVVPLLYDGVFDLTKIDAHMEDLKLRGSRLVPGFMRPEGVVISTMGHRWKRVFDAEETKWKKGDDNYKALKVEQAQGPDLSHLLQPIRLEKLLSRDERYIKEFPKSIPQIAEAYWQDLLDEQQVVGPEEYLQVTRKHFNKDLFKFCRQLAAEAKNKASSYCWDDQENFS